MRNQITIGWFGPGNEQQEMCADHRHLRIRSSSQIFDKDSFAETQGCDILVIDNRFLQLSIEQSTAAHGIACGIVLINSPYDLHAALRLTAHNIYAHLGPRPSASDICRAIRAAADRSFSYHNELRAYSCNDSDGQIPTLSKRESQIIKYVKAGASNLEIASALAISQHTVKSHIRGVMDKLGVRRRVQLALMKISA